MKKVLLLSCLLCLFCGCSIFEIKQEHYKKNFGKIPQEGVMSAESTASLARASTEVNKGLSRIKGLFEHSEAMDPVIFVKKSQKMYPQVEAVYDFSFLMIDFFGAMLTEIDWDNPDKFLDDLKAERDSYKKAQVEKKELEQKYEQDKKAWEQNLMQKDNIVKDKDAEMQSRDGQWSMKLAFWVKVTWWLVVFAGIWLFWPYLFAVVKKKLAGMTWKVALGTTDLFKKGAGQTFSALQKYRNHLKDKIQNGGTAEEKKAKEDELNMLDSFLRNAQDKDVKDFIKVQKEKKKINPDLL